MRKKIKSIFKRNWKAMLITIGVIASIYYMVKADKGLLNEAIYFIGGAAVLFVFMLFVSKSWLSERRLEWQIGCFVGFVVVSGLSSYFSEGPEIVQSIDRMEDKFESDTSGLVRLQMLKRDTLAMLNTAASSLKQREDVVDEHAGAIKRLQGEIIIMDSLLNISITSNNQTYAKLWQKLDSQRRAPLIPPCRRTVAAQFNLDDWKTVPSKDSTRYIAKQ